MLQAAPTLFLQSDRVRPVRLYRAMMRLKGEAIASGRLSEEPAPLPPWALEAAADPLAGYDRSRAAHAAFYDRFDLISTEVLPYEGPDDSDPPPKNREVLGRRRGIAPGDTNVMVTFDDCWVGSVNVRDNRFRISRAALRNATVDLNPVVISGLRIPTNTTSTS
jgi:hypothetical protein